MDPTERDLQALNIVESITKDQQSSINSNSYLDW